MKRLLLAIAAFATVAFAAQQVINIGTTANDATGDTLRTAFGKVNTNTTELYNLAVTNWSGRFNTGQFTVGASTNVSIKSGAAVTNLLAKGVSTIGNVDISASTITFNTGAGTITTQDNQDLTVTTGNGNLIVNGGTGLTQTVTFYSVDSGLTQTVTNVVTIKNGIITAWAQ